MGVDRFKGDDQFINGIQQQWCSCEPNPKMNRSTTKPGGWTYINDYIDKQADGQAGKQATVISTSK